MRTRLGSVVAVSLLLAGVMVLPAGASASGLVVQRDASVPVPVGVAVDTVDGEVSSEESAVTRPSPPDEGHAPQQSDEPETSGEPAMTDEPETSGGPEALNEPASSDEPPSTEVADPVTVSATNVPSRAVGALTRVWGRVNGFASGEVFTEVVVAGEWARSEVTVSDATGYYQIPLTYGAERPGTYTYRVGAATPDGTVYSDTFTLTRTVVVATVSASNVPSKAVGALTRVWGRVNGFSGGQVFTEVLVGGGWSRSQTVTSGVTGYYQIPLTYGSNTVGTYTYRVGAVTPGGTAYSDTFTLTRTAPAATVSASNVPSKAAGALTRVWGRVNGFSGGQVFTEVLVGGRWSRSQTVTSDSTGYYQIPLTYGAKTVGTYTYRVGANTPSGTVYSNTFTLTRTPPPRPPAGSALDCSSQPDGKAIMVDKVAMRAWLCRNGAAVSGLMPFTSGPTYQAPKGVYRVFFKRNPWWSAGGQHRLDNFTAFTRGVGGDRIGFHKYVVMPESQVGTEAWRNRSGGCFRMRARDAQTIYQFTGLGTVVRVLNNG